MYIYIQYFDIHPATSMGAWKTPIKQPTTQMNIEYSYMLKRRCLPSWAH